MSSRQTLWRILLEQSRLADARGDSAQSKTLRQQARGVVEYIVDHTPEDLRSTFLALPRGRQVMEAQ